MLQFGEHNGFVVYVYDKESALIRGATGRVAIIVSKWNIRAVCVLSECLIA